MRQHFIALLWILVMLFLDGVAVAHAEPDKQHNASIQKLSVLWPRLFFDVTERQQIETQRQAGHADRAVVERHTVPNTDAVSPSTPLVTSLELQGISQTATGRSAWLNGATIRSGDSYGGWSVEVEADRVRLNAPDQKELVLRPGQRADLIRSEVTDVVPGGSFGVKPPKIP